MARECKRCYMGSADSQVFHDEIDDLTYMVAKARAIIQTSPRELVIIPPGQAYEAVLQASINQRHAKHVDISFPSIAVKRKGKYMFIDGNHRVFARLCKMLPIRAYVLTAKEKRVILQQQ